MGTTHTADSSTPKAHWFTTTHWSVVLAARDRQSPQAVAALEKLCRTYRSPLYAFIRRQNFGPEDAEDLTQAFLARMLEKNHLARIEHQEGKFRSFILTLLKNFLSDERDKAQAQKRGGGQTPIFLDALSEEERYQVEPATNVSPEVLFDKRWAETVLEQALQALRGQYEQEERSAMFEALAPYLPGASGPPPSYADTAARLGMTESAVTAAINRIRRRFATTIRDEVAQTVRHRDEIDEEIRYLVEIRSR
jgi:RNA polymerase sigma-70 factor (ECF subfamily)